MAGSESNLTCSHPEVHVETLWQENQRLQAEMAQLRKERADAVNHAEQIRPHTWQQQRHHLVREVDRLQTQLAAQAEVIEAAASLVKSIVQCDTLLVNTSTGNTATTEYATLCATLARLNAERAVAAGIVLPRGDKDA